MLLVLGAPCQLVVLAGPELGRTIPLAEVDPARLHQGGSSAASAADDPLRLFEVWTSHVTAGLLDRVGVLLDQ